MENENAQKTHRPNTIPLSAKREAVEGLLNGKTYREVYNEIFYPQYKRMSFETFKRKIQYWRSKAMADELTEQAGTYPGMVARGATVQVNALGQISQAWIRQTAEVIDWDDIVEHLQNNVPTIDTEPTSSAPDPMLLEIPLFDLHFGVAHLRDYERILGEIEDEIRSRVWEEIHVIIGQDCLHNNDFRGHTAKGTDIEAVDIPQAWADAWAFWTTILRRCLEHSPRVVAHYSRGNHDECISWAFFKALEAGVPCVEFDASLAHRKAFLWRRCWVGFGHLEYTTDSNKIFRDFVIEFPEAFAAAECREIHAGHLHRESCDNGIMVRRLASAVPTDGWSAANGFTGAHKRFQMFEFAPGRLRSVVYT